MTISKKKAKMSVADQGGLLLAAVPIHSSIKDRHKELTDGALAETAVVTLEDYSAKLEELASMTNIFEGDSGFFDAPKAQPQPAAKPVSAEEEDVSFEAPTESDDDLLDPVSIGGFEADGGEDFNFDEVAIGGQADFSAEFDIGQDQSLQAGGFSFDELSPAEIASGEQEAAAWNDWQEPVSQDPSAAGLVVAEEFASADFIPSTGEAFVAAEAVAESEEDLAFEVMPEDEIAQNVEISDKIIKLSEQAEEFDIGDDDEFAPEDFSDEDHDGFEDEDFDGDIDSEYIAKNNDDFSDDLRLDDPSAAAQAGNGTDFDMTGDGRDGFDLEDFPHEATDSSQTAGDDWSHLPSPAPEGYGDDDGLGWGSDYNEPAAAAEPVPMDDGFTFEDEAQATSAVPDVTAEDVEYDWDEASFEGVDDEPQVYTPAAGSEGVKPVDHRESDISGFDLSSDIEGSEAELGVAAVAAVVAASRTVKTEGVPGVKFGKKQKEAEHLEEDHDEFTDINNEGDDENIDDHLTDASTNEEEDAAVATPPAKKKVKVVKKIARPAPEVDTSKKKVMLYAGVAVAALVIGAGGLMVAKTFLGGGASQDQMIYQQPSEVPAPQVSAPQPPAVIPAPVVAPLAPEVVPAVPEVVQQVPLAPVEQEPAVQAEPSVDTEASAGVSDDLFGDLADLQQDVSLPTAPEAGVDTLAAISSGLEAAANGSIEDLLLAAEPPAPEEPALDLDKALEGYAKVDDVNAFRSDIDEIRRMFDEYRAELDAKDARIATLEADLSGAKSQAAHAEQLALAQNEVLVEVVRLTDKTDMAESLIVDLSKRVAGLEVIDPADRVAVERTLEQFDTRLKGLSRDIGMLARVAINGSPVALPNTTKAGSAGGGGDAVFADGGRVNGMPSAARPENVPSNAKKGDHVEGYGKVLDIIPTSDGSTLIVMENGSVIK